MHGSAERLNQRYAQHHAVAVDRTPVVTPYIDYTDPALSLGIGARQAVIFEPTRRGASDLAIILRSGPLPFSFTAVH